MESFLYFLAGSMVSWLVTMIYYRKSSVKVPEWARPIVEHLPEKSLNKEEFAELFDEKMKDLVIDGGEY